LNVEMEKVNMHKGVMMKALLNSSATEIFMDQKIAVRHGFRLQKLEKPIVVRNVNGTNNSARAIIHQIEMNVYYKDHIEKMKMNVCNLERTDVILEIL